MEITLEIAKTMLDSGIEELVDIAVQAFPELGGMLMEGGMLFSILQRKIKRVNKGVVSYLKDSKSREYYPVFYYDESNLFSFGYVSLRISYLCIPAPLCFVDKGVCEVFVKENLKLYQQLYEGTCI